MLSFHDFCAGLPILILAGVQCLGAAALMFGLFPLVAGIWMYRTATCQKDAMGSPILIVLGVALVIGGAVLLALGLFEWAEIPAGRLQLSSLLSLGCHALGLGAALAVVGKALLDLVNKAFPGNASAETLPLLLLSAASLFAAGGLSTLLRAGLLWL